MTNEEQMIDGINTLPALGLSDHILVLCDNNDKSIIAKARPLLDNNNALCIILIIM